MKRGGDSLETGEWNQIRTLSSAVQALFAPDSNHFSHGTEYTSSGNSSSFSERSNHFAHVHINNQFIGFRWTKRKKVHRDAIATSQPSVCLLYRAMEGTQKNQNHVATSGLLTVATAIIEQQITTD